MSVEFDIKYVALLLLEAICRDNDLPGETLINVMDAKEKYINRG